jgi:predicted nucleotidyltransferase
MVNIRLYMLIDLFKTEERVKILRYIMFHSRFTVAEISMITGITKGLVSRYLRYLEDHELLFREGRKFSPRDSAQTRAIKLLLNLERINLSTLNLDFALSLGLYGSWARGTNHHDSDLDVWIKAESLPSEKELARLQRDLSLQVGSEVNLLVLTPEKLERLKIEDPPFYTSLVINSVIMKGEPLEDY